MSTYAEPKLGTASVRIGAAKAAEFSTLLALLLLVALTLVALPAEASDDRWLRIGSVMMAAGLAVWLKLRWLLPAVLLLWLVPLLARDLMSESRDIGWVEAAELGGLMFIAIGFHYSYTTAALEFAGERGRVADEEQPAVKNPKALEDLSPDSRGGLPSPMVTASAISAWRGRMWASGPGISEADAADLLRRLRALDVEVVRTRELMHPVKARR